MAGGVVTRPRVFAAGEPLDDVDWIEPARDGAAAPARGDREDARAEIAIEEAARWQERRRKWRSPPDPRFVRSRQVRDRYGEAAFEWLVAECEAGRVRRVGADRWQIDQATLDELVRRKA